MVLSNPCTNNGMTQPAEGQCSVKLCCSLAISSLCSGVVTIAASVWAYFSKWVVFATCICKVLSKFSWVQRWQKRLADLSKHLWLMLGKRKHPNWGWSLAGDITYHLRWEWSSSSCERACQWPACLYGSFCVQKNAVMMRTDGCNIVHMTHMHDTYDACAWHTETSQNSTA